MSMPTFTKETRHLDRSNWCVQPDDESDHVEWVDATTGMLCAAHRNTMGAWCGYVGVESDHPWYLRKYSHGPDDIYERAPDGYIQVHGGLTFSNSEAPERDTTTSRWWFGFDCAHLYDLIPKTFEGMWPRD